MLNKDKKTRRQFIVATAGSVFTLGIIGAIVPLIHSLNPAADVLSLATIEVDISNIQPGDNVTIKWRGKPVFIRHRTDSEMSETRKVKINTLPDPEEDVARVKKSYDKWLVVLGICTHLGCVPESNKGDYGGWYCPCHGSHYDISGRIRKGPAPSNLVVPKYEFLSPTKIKIG